MPNHRVDFREKWIHCVINSYNHQYIDGHCQRNWIAVDCWWTSINVILITNASFYCLTYHWLMSDRKPWIFGKNWIHCRHFFIPNKIRWHIHFIRACEGNPSFNPSKYLILLEWTFTSSLHNLVVFFFALARKLSFMCSCSFGSDAPHNQERKANRGQNLHFPSKTFPHLLSA